MGVLTWAFAIGLAIPTLVVASYPIHAWLVLKRSARGPGPGAVSESLSVLVPVKGLDEGRKRVLEAMTAQRAPGHLEWIFCVESEDDPAAGDLRELEKTDPARIRVLFTGPSGRRLGKLHNLMVGIAVARGDWLAFIDSDTILPHENYLREFTAHLASSTVGLVTCYPSYRAARSVPAAMLAGAINHDLLGIFAVQSVWGGLRLANGSCMAIRRELLEEIGGFSPQESCLLMDVILARRVVRAGYRVLVHNEPVEVPCRTVTVRVWWHQAHRWQVGMRRVLSGPFYVWYSWMRSAFPAALIALPFVSGQIAFIAGVAVTVRLSVMVVMSQVFIHDRSQLRFLWVLPITDIVTAVGCWLALVRTRVEWRGRRYQVTNGGFTRRIA